MHKLNLGGVAGSWPSGKILPVLQVVNINSIVSMRCFSEGETVWIRNDYIISRGEELLFKKASQNHSGKYYCQGISKGTTFMAKSALIVAGNNNIWEKSVAVLVSCIINAAVN